MRAHQEAAAAQLAEAQALHARAEKREAAADVRMAEARALEAQVAIKSKQLDATAAAISKAHAALLQRCPHACTFCLPVGRCRF